MEFDFFDIRTLKFDIIIYSDFKLSLGDFIMSELKKEYNCSLILTFDLLGGKWKLRILWHIINGDNRFSLLLKSMPEITEKVLTTQLRNLEKNGLLERTVISQKPLNVQYNLSEKYSELVPIIGELCRFSRDYAIKNNIIINDSK